MQNPGYQNYQPQPQQFMAAPMVQPPMMNVGGSQYQPAPMVMNATTSQVYPVQQGAYNEQQAQLAQPNYQQQARPLVRNIQEPYGQGSNQEVRNVVFWCCCCGVIVVILSAVLGTILGPPTGGIGLSLWILIPVGLCCMCIGCIACFAINPNEDFVNRI